MTQLSVAPPSAGPADFDLRTSSRWHALHSLLTPSWERMLPHERFKAVGLALRDRLLDVAIQTDARYRAADAKTVYYLSMEFLLGRSLGNNLANLGLLGDAASACAGLDQDLGHLEEAEHDA